MQFFQAIIMGIVQGLSEFLPISSSAHLVFSSNFYKYFAKIQPHTVDINQEVFFDIMLHLGTLIAVLIFFRKDIIEIIKSFYLGFTQKNYSDKNFKLGIYIIIGTFLTVLVAYPLSPISEKLVATPEITSVLLIVTGIFLILSEWYNKKYLNKKDINIKSSVIIGFAQGLASLPGFSRSGFTIASALFSGVERSYAARYSFLLSIPIILGASMVYPLASIDTSEITNYNWPAIISGTIVSGIVGYYCVKYFLKFVSKFSLSIFGYYCITVGIICAIFFTMI